MGEPLTLIASADAVAARVVALPEGISTRPAAEGDAEALAQLHVGAYDPGVGPSSLLDAREEIRRMLAGARGRVWLEASRVAVDDADGRLVACAIAVAETPGKDGPEAGPRVIELLTQRRWRGRGLASSLLADAARVVAGGGALTLTVEVDSGNIGALRLFAAAGFAGVGQADADAMARATEAEMGDWRAEFAPHPEPARRRGLMDTADVVSTVMGMFAMLLAIGIPIAFVGLVIWLFFSLMGDPAPEVSPSPQAGADRVPSWVVGYVAGPGRTELTLVVEACDEWNLDETWTSKQDAAHVELWVGWWSMSLPPCEAPELRTFEFGLLEPLGDRTVFLLGGGEVPRFEGELPPGDS